MFAALSALDPEFRLFFTLANADAEGRALNDRIKAFVSSRPNTIAVASLGQLRYISLMNQVDLVVGNSSSGVLEAPSLNVPTVDIGDRQKGRERASSVFNAPPERSAIVAAISKALLRGRQPTVSPYGDGESSQRFADGDRRHPGFPHAAQEGLLRSGALRDGPMTQPHTLIIAEAGVNHSGSLDTALALVDAAADAGADIVKFQTFNANSLAGRSAREGGLSATHHRRVGKPACDAAAAGIAARGAPHPDRACQATRHRIPVDAVRSAVA